MCVCVCVGKGAEEYNVSVLFLTFHVDIFVDLVNSSVLTITGETPC